MPSVVAAGEQHQRRQREADRDLLPADEFSMVALDYRSRMTNPGSGAQDQATDRRCQARPSFPNASCGKITE
jgi:hypothetical protein